MGDERRAYFSIRTQFDNIGDALITRELVRLVASEAQAAIDLSRCPPTFRRALGIDAIEGAHVVASSTALFRSMFAARARGITTYYFLSPGGYFGDLSFRGGLAYRAKTAMLQLLTVVGVRVCLIGVSYDRLGPRRVALLRQRARILHRHIVRDEDSLGLLRELGVRVQGQMPDLAFGAFAECGDIASRDRSPRVAFSFRVDQYPGQAVLVERVAEEIVAHLPAGRDVVVVAQVTRDIPFAKGLAARLSARRVRAVAFESCDEAFDRCKEVYGAVTAIVSNRLHALLGATLCGATPVPLVAPAVNAKVLGWARDAGIQGNVRVVDVPGVGVEIAAALEANALASIDCRMFSEMLAQRVHEVMRD